MSKHIKEEESSENNVYEAMVQKGAQEDSFKVGDYFFLLYAHKAQSRAVTNYNQICNKSANMLIKT